MTDPEIINILDQILNSDKRRVGTFEFSKPFFDNNRACSVRFTSFYGLPGPNVLYVGLMGLDGNQLFWVVPWEETEDESPVTRYYDLPDPNVTEQKIREDIVTEIKEEIERQENGGN